MQLFDTLPRHIEDALRASIERFGVLVPIVVTQHGEVLDGHHRKRIADELGVGVKVSVIEVADDDEARAIAVTLNADRRQLDPEQRREVVAHLRQQGHSYRAIGEALGVDHTTAYDDYQRTVGDPTVEQPETVRGLDGKERPATRKVTERESSSTTVETPADRAMDLVESAPVTGMDGKQYPASRPSSPPTPKRRALPDQFFDAAYDLTKKVESVHRLTEDDRFSTNKQKVAEKHLNDLLEASDLLNQVINRLQEG